MTVSVFAAFSPTIIGTCTCSLVCQIETSLAATLLTHREYSMFCIIKMSMRELTKHIYRALYRNLVNDNLFAKVSWPQLNHLQPTLTRHNAAYLSHKTEYSFEILWMLLIFKRMMEASRVSFIQCLVAIRHLSLDSESHPLQPARCNLTE